MKTDYALLTHNTFGIRAHTAWFAQYDSVQELQQLIAWYHQNIPDKPLLHIGKGSNLLFLSDFPGLVLHSRIKGIEILSDQGDDLLIRVGAGIVWDDLVAHCVSQGWYGLENLSYIPGEVGASAVQNIGAYGAEACNFIQSVECVSLQDGESRIFQASECQYGYRQSIFKGELRGQYAVTHVVYRLSHRFTPHLEYGGIRQALADREISESQLDAQTLRDVIIAIRQSKLPDPAVQGNAGSFFMNPIVPMSVYENLQQRYPQMPHYPVDADHEKIPAGWLIQQSGWKGRSLGRAAVHDRQALVLVNLGGATGQDILCLCQAVRASVYQQFGIDLKPEVNFIG